MLVGKIIILFDDHLGYPEIELSGRWDTLASLGKIINEVKDYCEIQAEQKKSDIYTGNLNLLILQRDESERFKDLIEISVCNKNLVIKGNQVAFNNLGDSLINVFTEDTFDGYHIHLDYFEGNSLVAPTNCNLVIACNSDILNPLGARSRLNE